MKKRFWVLLLTLSFLSNGLFSQIDSAKKGKVVLKYAPLSILDPNLTTLQFGLEYYLSDKYSIQIEYGQKIPFSDSASLRPSFKGGNGFRIKTETHYHFASNYVGLELFYWQNNYSSYDALLDTVLNRTEKFKYKVKNKHWELP